MLQIGNMCSKILDLTPPEYQQKNEFGFEKRDKIVHLAAILEYHKEYLGDESRK